MTALSRAGPGRPIDCAIPSRWQAAWNGGVFAALTGVHDHIGDLPPGQCLDPGEQAGLVGLDYGDVTAFLLLGQPVQVRPHGMQGIEGHHGAGQVQGLQERGEVAGLVVLDVDLEVVQEAQTAIAIRQGSG
jgi:hypothetical protein